MLKEKKLKKVLADKNASPSTFAAVFLPKPDPEDDKDTQESGGQLQFFKRPTIFRQEKPKPKGLPDLNDETDDESTSESGSELSEPPPPPSEPHKASAEPVDFHIQSFTDKNDKRRKKREVDEDGDFVRKLHNKQRKLHRPQFSHEEDEQII